MTCWRISVDFVDGGLRQDLLLRFEIHINAAGGQTVFQHLSGLVRAIL